MKYYHLIFIIVLAIYLLADGYVFLVKKTLLKQWSTGRKLAPWEVVVRKTSYVCSVTGVWALAVVLAMAVVDLIIHIIL